MRWGHGDNYCYVLSSQNKHWLIDPAEPQEVIPFIKKDEIVGIVNTHHHYDHAGGNEELLKWLGRDVPVIGGKMCPLVSKVPKDGEIMKLGDISITAIHTPCHTQDSICYYAEQGQDRFVFTGDTLFTAGCGRFFEGTGEEMDKSLTKLSKLPKDTIVFPGHEYTKSNVKFAKKFVNNEAMKKLEDFCSKNEVTTGAFTINDELEFNPFMRLDDPEIQAKLGTTSRSEIMDKLRQLKNNS